MNWHQEDFLFFTGRGPFGEYLAIFNLCPTSYCACGKEGKPLHYVTGCQLTESWHLTKPAAHLQSNWSFRLGGPGPTSVRDTKLCSPSATSTKTQIFSSQINNSPNAGSYSQANHRLAPPLLQHHDASPAASQS
ncbi:hypothetical protein AVEN_101233-1 [Araneus ventricosus]|uniref:Uncharacterized protein n=1 Tax=Araneus ventricosus TaxID=182803 RepID=A0A4Y2KQV3_ARAVE|nr:hypothetical protein AVEN_101233-1 [Araneus ventricosus]